MSNLNDCYLVVCLSQTYRSNFDSDKACQYEVRLLLWKNYIFERDSFAVKQCQELISGEEDFEEVLHLVLI